nr:hypothetical protein [Candidatus Woesearchaeota archaeon]
MLKRGYKLLGMLLLVSLVFTVSSFVVNAQKQGSCINPLGKTFCDNYNPTDQCYCDSKCEEYKDCCSDYQNVCKGGSTGGGGGGSGGGTLVCGNGIREGNEVCDGSDLGGNTCTSLGYLQGQLKCQSNCVAFDTSGCVKKDVPTDVSGNITEAVTCVFEGSSKQEYCTKADSGFGQLVECEGVGYCSVKVSGKKGEQVTWKSSCGGYAYTTMDGVDEKIAFNCGQKTEVVGFYRNAEWVCYDGSKSLEGGPTSCKSKEVWNQYANDFCNGRCNNDKTKCGVNSFSTSNSCSNTTTGPIPKCVDTDNGVNEFEAGKTYMSDNENSVHYDTCLYDQSNSLIEYSCFNNVIQKTQIQCKNGCKEGACLKQVSTCLPQAPIGCPNVECLPGYTSVQNPQTCCYKCVTQGSSNLKAYTNKPYTTNNPFFLSASGFSENSIITSVNWNHGPKDNPCKFTTKQDKGLKVSSSVYSEIEVACNTPGVKSFIVTFTDDKGNKADDLVSVYVNEGKKIYQQATTPTTTAKIQQSKSNSNSCQNRCGFYDPKESCQCDDVCKDYGDCCLDKAQTCG